MKIKTYGSMKDKTFTYNSFLNDDQDKKKSRKDSKGEIIDNNLLKNNSLSDTNNELTINSTKPSYIEKYENCTKILRNLEKQCI